MIRKTQADKLIISGGRVIDPWNDVDETRDLYVAEGRFVESPPDGATMIDAEGLIVAPGLVDMHVHLREPGQTHKEDIATGSAAAIAGGFTTVACMPNTRPPLDSPDSIQEIYRRADEVGLCDVLPIATISRERSGKKLADLSALKKAGAIAFSDDGDGVEDDAVMRAAFAKAAELDAVLIQHCEYKHLSAGGVMHLGEVSRRLELPGLDPRSEEAMIERDIDLCRETGGRYHVAHISTARAVELVRNAKREGLPVTSEVCTHHLLLTDEACAGRDPNTKMHPPLRPAADVDACRRGLWDGTIDCIVTDHAPHAREEKDVGFLKAPPGIIGLETAVAIAARAMIESGPADWSEIVRWFTWGPSRVLGIPANPLISGVACGITLIDPNLSWLVSDESLASRSRNTPFMGWTFTGRPIGCVRAGQILTFSGQLDPRLR